MGNNVERNSEGCSKYDFQPVESGALLETFNGCNKMFRTLYWGVRRLKNEAQFGQHLILHTFSFDPPDEFALETDDVESDADVVVVEGRAVSRVS